MVVVNRKTKKENYKNKNDMNGKKLINWKKSTLLFAHTENNMLQQQTST